MTLVPVAASIVVGATKGVLRAGFSAREESSRMAGFRLEPALASQAVASRLCRFGGAVGVLMSLA